MSDYQLLVIGAGPGGYTAALAGARRGLRTAVVENREAGGTCLNRGCVPTKALLHASEVFTAAKNGGSMGVCTTDIHPDIGAMFSYKRGISQKLAGGVESLLKSAKVELLRGSACITAPGEVTVTDKEGHTQIYTADAVLAATGSQPARPPIPGLSLPGVMTSDELLEGTDHLYESLVIIGGGVIGVEFATFYSDLGCQVTLLEGMDHLLPTMDRELGQNLGLLLKRRGVQVCTGALVERVEESDSGLTVRFSVKSGAETVRGEAVLCAIGRKPYLTGLFAPGLSPRMEGSRLWVDERYQTSIPRVYAIGDVSSPVPLAHVAAAQGTAAVDFLCGRENSVRMDIVPSCIYCRPEIAVAGLPEAEAKAAGLPVQVGKCVMGGNARTLIADPGRSFMKVLANAETHEIIGAHLMCPHSTDIIGELCAAMASHLTAEELLRTMRPHPTFEEALGEALHELCARLARNGG
ncbi:MAG: dihydrolipoyl dehydrogenase [Clostridiales bacterium]|nr:dihydrolipoyl dehydrogenase [Clostridiales bacterium]